MSILRVFGLLIALLFAQSAQGSDDSVLTVMTFNLRYGTADDGYNSWPNRDHLVMRVFRERDAQIIGVQEALAFQLNEITAEFPHYAVIGVGRDDGKNKGEYAAILYDTRRFAVDTSGTFWLSDTPEVVASTSWGNSITRICTWARLIDRDSGVALYVYNAHYDHRSQGSREKSSQLILDRIASRAHDDPVVLMGDFNAGESNPAITALLKNPELTHTYRSVHPDETTVGTFNGFDGTSDGEMIDHIFVSPGLKTIAADIDRTNDNARYPSDHFPVWASFKLR
ncbi:MAG: endonuclease/exonuclease/phosphatase family protein [Phycisphaerales bacterium]|nr:endonuclease/exonuclease/phosphatase family protein [Phycisphaerales bacterium]